MKFPRRALITAAAATVAVIGLSGCGPKKDAAASAASAGSSGTPAPKATVTLTGQAATISGAEDGTVATVVNDPAGSAGAETAPAAPPEKSAQETFADALAQDTNLSADAAATPADQQWVTVKSADGQFSMDVPAEWSYLEFQNGVGGRTFGATSGDAAASGSQRILSATRTSSAEVSLNALADELRGYGCQPSTVRPFTNDLFGGQGESFPCSDGRSIVGIYLDGKGEKSWYHGSIIAQINDAEGVAAMQRAVTSLDVAGDPNATPST